MRKTHLFSLMAFLPVLSTLRRRRRRRTDGEMAARPPPDERSFISSDEPSASPKVPSLSRAPPDRGEETLIYQRFFLIQVKRERVGRSKYEEADPDAAWGRPSPSPPPPALGRWKTLQHGHGLRGLGGFKISFKDAGLYGNAFDLVCIYLNFPSIFNIRGYFPHSPIGAPKLMHSLLACSSSNKLTNFLLCPSGKKAKDIRCIEPYPPNFWP